MHVFLFFFVIPRARLRLDEGHIGSSDIHCKYQYYDGFRAIDKRAVFVVRTSSKYEACFFFILTAREHG